MNLAEFRCTGRITFRHERSLSFSLRREFGGPVERVNLTKHRLFPTVHEELYAQLCD